MKVLNILIVVGLVGSVVYATDKAQVVKQKASETVQAASDYTKEQKEEIQKSTEDKLNTISAEISDLKKDAKNATGKAKEEIDQELKYLERKQASLKKDLQRWKESSGKAWDEMKSGMSAAVDRLGESYQRAKKELKEKKSE